MIKVSVPATSANLGVGFDCLGIAVNDNASFTFYKSKKRLIIKGCDKTFQNKNNLVYQAFQKGCLALNKLVPNIEIHINSNIPLSRGLGSSATCIVGGLVAAFNWFNHDIDKNAILKLAYKLEGHGDNIGPAIFGGLCAIVDVNDQPNIIKYPVNAKLNWIAIIPNTKVSTKDARATLPKQVNHSIVSYQLSHSLLLINALQNGNIKQIQNALDDHINEPYRAKLIPYIKRIKSLVKKLNSCLYISGSGSTMMIINDNIQNKKKIINYIQKSFPNWIIKELMMNNTGVKSKITLNEF